jgi:microcystin degradation protein MlrC
MKIGIGGLAIESCTFSPLLSTEADFTVVRGQALLDSYPFLAGRDEITHAPLLYARALPGGPVEAGFYRRIKAEFLRLLEESSPLDGLFLHMHGAVSVEGMQDAEGDFLSAVRQAAGPGCFVAASYDLHGNLSERVMRSLDFLSAYRTAPHVDWLETLERVYRFLVRFLERGERPYQAWMNVPVLFSGEKSSTEWEPAASLYRQIPGTLRPDAVLDASILIGYAWADEPRSAASVTAFGMDREAVQSVVRGLARQVWEARGQFQFGVEAASIDRCIQLAMESNARPVVISDSGDNPTAGGAGDTPILLERLAALGARDAVFASIADAEAVRQCEAAGAGSTLDLSLGGKLDPIHARPFATRARVRSLHQVPWTRGHTREESPLNRIAVVEIAGGAILANLTSRRTPFHRISDFTRLGIDPHEHQIIVVKIGYLEPELRALAAKALLALSPGAVNQAMQSEDYHRIRRPIYPFDTDFEWDG